MTAAIGMTDDLAIAIRESGIDLSGAVEGSLEGGVIVLTDKQGRRLVNPPGFTFEFVPVGIGPMRYVALHYPDMRNIYQ